MIEEKRITILHKIKNKPLLMEHIFSFCLNRPNIFYYLLSADTLLNQKLKTIISNIEIHNNKLDESFNNSLIIYSSLKEINDNINKWYDKIKNKPLNYDFLEKVLNFSYINYLYTKLSAFMKKKKYNNLNNQSLKSIVFDFYSSFQKIIVTFSDDKNNSLDSEFLDYIENANEKCKDINKIKKDMKLIIIISVNKNLNQIYQRIKYFNINEIEIFFKIQYLCFENVYFMFNSFFSKIDFLENVNKIIIHNKISKNYNNDKCIINNDNKCYQSLLSFIFDEYYLEEKKGISNYIQKCKKLKEFNIENISFLYIYEKMKLYYSIKNILPIFGNDKKNKIDSYLNDKILIISNNLSPLKVKDLTLLIKEYFQINIIEYLLIINHSSLLTNEIKEIKINIDNIKEFMYISKDESSNNKELINIFFAPNQNDRNNNIYIYEGYNTDNQLIIYRRGLNNIKSFDLIDLFKYNKKLTLIKLIKEKIEIKLNLERTKLEIINLEKTKNELNEIININNYYGIKNFSSFIYNQKYLNELSLIRFDCELKDISNLNLKILNINYEPEISVMRYDIIFGEQHLKYYFPKLEYLNIGGKLNFIINLQKDIIPKNLKCIRVISVIGNKNISKIRKKFKKMNINFEFKAKTENLDEENNECDEKSEENEYEYEYEKKDNVIFNYKKEKFSKDKYKGFGFDYFLKTYSLHCPDCLKERHIAFLDYSHKFNSIFEHSDILKEYSKIANSEIYKELKDKIDLFLEINEYKLIYRAKDHKHLEKLIKIGSELKEEKYVSIIKIKILATSGLNNDVFYFLLIPNYCIFLFSKIKLETKCNEKIKFDKEISQIEIENIFIYQNELSEGYFSKECDCLKNNSFVILDFEIFEIIKSEKSIHRFFTFEHFIKTRKTLIYS